MIDEASWTELCDGKEARPLDIALAFASLTARHECHQRKPGEIVARQEPFRRQVAINIEVGALPLGSSQQQLDLNIAGRLACFRRTAFLRRNRIILQRSGGVFHLPFGRCQEVPPAVESVGKAFRRGGNDAARMRVGPANHAGGVSP